MAENGSLVTASSAIKSLSLHQELVNECRASRHKCMSRNRHPRAEVSPAIKLAARQRVEAVWTCLEVLCPDLELKDKKVLAEKVLDLSRGEDRKAPRILISPAQVASIILPNMQCINPRCPILLFSNQIADELNEFFKGEG